MGFFSWKTQDTQKSIPSFYSTRETFLVFMHDNKGNKWKEEEYEGYGVFGGKDFYELLAEMNGLATREEGIGLAFSGKPCLWPNLTESEHWDYTPQRPERCKDQGYFYNDDQEEDEDNQ